MKTTVEERRPAPSPGRQSSATSTTASVGVHTNIKTILVPLDFSPPAMEALDYANQLATQFTARIHLVYVQTPDEACDVPAAGHLIRECAESVTFLREKLSGIRQGSQQFWPENCHIRTGRAHDAICELARELPVDLIVIASRGNTGLKRVVLGSTAERVARFSPCPVLVVRKSKDRSHVPHGPRTARKGLAIRKILAPVDFSQCSMASAMYAAFLSRTLKTKLCLFHVVQQPAPIVMNRPGASFRNGAKLNLANARLDMEAFSKLGFLQNVEPTVEIRTGRPVDEICRETSQSDIDLVVISTHGRTGFERAIIGSVAEHVARYAKCPVLVVPSRCSNS